MIGYLNIDNNNIIIIISYTNEQRIFYQFRSIIDFKKFN